MGKLDSLAVEGQTWSSANVDQKHVKKTKETEIFCNGLSQALRCFNLLSIVSSNAHTCILFYAISTFILTCNAGFVSVWSTFVGCC